MDCDDGTVMMAATDSKDDDGSIDLYSDGACLGNPGPGGWGVVLKWRGIEKELSGGEGDTTNNRMELTAAIKGLAALKKRSTVRIHTDSTYVRDGITKWIHNWKRNGWKTAGKKPVKNVDLWQQLEQAITRHSVEWHWVKGHAGHPGNEHADRLAGEAARQFSR